MAQMSVPAEPSYKTTSYNGLKGADFSNDPSLVARNHSPDLLNMISDNGGSPIKRKGWEVTDEISGKKIVGIWHFQMFGKVWHVAFGEYTYHDPIEGNVLMWKPYAIDDDGNATALGSGDGYVGRTDSKPNGIFFNSADPAKTGLYVFMDWTICFIRPANATSTTLTASAVTPTVPVARELTNYRGEGGITYGLNLLTNKATYKFYDGRATTFTPRHYYVFPENSPFSIHSIESVKLLKTDGTWETVSSSNYSIGSTGRSLYLQTDTYISDTTMNIIEVTVEISGIDATENAKKICNCNCATVYSQMTAGQVFVSGNPDYPQYVWYSELDDPTYFPDINYLFVGGAGTKVKGMIPFNSQIAVFKEPSVTESTIFMLNYTTATDQKVGADGVTSTETRDVYQVKHGFTGIGSLSADTVFSLGDEPLFLSQHGIMGMVSNAINSANAVKSRSDFLNPRLLEEDDLSNAVATVHKNYYILVVNEHAYILDMRQKSSDYKGNTSYLYESYYWDNIPASCIASDGETLWFGTDDGRICRFKNTGRMDDYSDGTHAGDEPLRVYAREDETWFVNSANELIVPDVDEKYMIMGTVRVNEGVVTVDPEYDDGTYKTHDVFSYNETGYEYEYTAEPIHAVWSTPLDNDGMTQYFKTLQKKGTGCTLYPYTRSSVDAYFEKDGNKEVYVGTWYVDIANWEDIDFRRFSFVANKAPRDAFFKKKMKKYKRLKIILKNEQLDEAFGVQEIFKTYLVTRYAK